jgi:hypothetical protein
VLGISHEQRQASQSAEQAALFCSKAAAFCSGFKAADFTCHLRVFACTGHVNEGTAWNIAFNNASIVTPPYDNDGNPAVFTTLELQNIM